MTRDLSAAHWWAVGEIDLYRYLPPAAAYRPIDPWDRGNGRFDAKGRLTLYLSASAEGAVAEWFRRHPEMLQLQDHVRLRLYRVALSVSGLCLDVREKPGADAAGIAWERLQSSDADETVRYGDCRALALDVEAAAGTGIAFASAAYDSAWNLVLFGASGTGWAALSFVDEPTPAIDETRLHALSA